MMIQGAARGRKEDREKFAKLYAPVVRSYLGARWRHASRSHELDDAVQEVFLECFRSGGVLEKADADRPGGFRAFLYGVVRNVARRIESKRAKQRECSPSSRFDLDAVERNETTLSRMFDRAWAKSLLREAAALQTERAQKQGEAACKRVELLRLRFHENLPLREIARLWNVEVEALRWEYRRAREEFRRVLLEVMSFHHPGSAAEIERECNELISSLGQ